MLIQDLIIINVPDFITLAVLDIPEVNQAFVDKLSEQAWKQVSAQYVKRTVELGEPMIEWLITGWPTEVEKWGIHECPKCREGREKARRFLVEHPDKLIALGNITYREIWT